MTDLGLAIAHHLAIFSLLALFAAEFAIVHSPIDERAVLRLSRMDIWYGALAGVVVVVGAARVFLAAKGWVFYQSNPWFWAKMAAFLMVGVLSVPPTIAFIRWGRAARVDSSMMPDVRAVSAVRLWMRIEAAFFVLIPVFAAAMARYTG